MSTDWNQKLAWVLRDLPDPNLDLLQLSAHRSDLCATDATIEVGPRTAWVSSSADRVPFPTGSAAERTQVDWFAHPEVTHPIAKARHKANPIDAEAARKAVAELLAESRDRFDRDPRRILLWMWRYLPERLAAAEKGPGAIATQIPADPRLPNLTLWQRIGFDAALAAASPSPTFLALQLYPPGGSFDECVTLEDLWTGSSMLTDLIWQAMLPIVEALGPEAILSPCLRGHPKVDAWLAKEGITSRDGQPITESPRMAGSFPTLFVALVPGDQARELGEACRKRFDDAWSKMVGTIRDKLVQEGWVKEGDEAWTSIWSRQTSRAWEMHWVAVAWGDDSTSAGSLLPKQEVTLLEKWARLQEDATGLEDPWPGIFFGLWYEAALSAAFARSRMGGVSLLCEPNQPCTACGFREALHDGSDGSEAGIQAFWKTLAGKAPRQVRAGEALCAVCTMRRMGGVTGLTPVPESLDKAVNEKGEFALIAFGLDQPTTLLRGGKELKQGATLGDCVHSALDKTFTKRARSHMKEILDTPSLLGPGRQAAVQEALGDFLCSTVPSLLEEYEACAVQVTDRELILAVPVSRAYGFVRKLRDQQRPAFSEQEKDSAHGIALRPGPQVNYSAIIAIVHRNEGMGALIQDCRSMLDELGRQMLGGDALVMVRRTPGSEDRIFAARWDDLATSVDVLLEAVPKASERSRLVQGLQEIVPALSNPDLDKTSPSSRASLTISTLIDLGLDPSVQDMESLARAVCQLVDQCVRLPNGSEENHALDGLHVTSSLSGAVQ